MTTAATSCVAGRAPGPLRTLAIWHQLAIQWLPARLGRFLDYGCGPCVLLDQLRHRADECHGVDVDADKIQAAAQRHPEFQLRAIDLSGRTPYPDSYFDTIAAVEVIEHVPEEHRMLQELCRVLKPGGRLLITTPHRGWLTFLDHGNFKFLFPGVHRFIHLRVRRNQEYYRQRFERGASKGLAGDISVGQRPPWHRHYRPEEVLAHCPPELEPLGHAVYFPGMRALMTLRMVLNVCTGGLIQTFRWPPTPFENLCRVQSAAGDQLVMLFCKQGLGTKDYSVSLSS